MAFSVAQTIAVFFNGKVTRLGAQPDPKLSATAAEEQFQKQSLVFDACLSENHSASSTITSHPVESGANVTDHVHNNPDVVTITGLVTNTPIRFPEGLPAVPVGQSFANLVNDVSNDLSKNAYDKLLALKNNKSLIKIATTLRTYENMLIESFEVSRDKETADALAFTMRLQQVRFVKTNTIELPTPVEPKLAKKKVLGNKPKKEISSSQPAAQKSVSTLQALIN